MPIRLRISSAIPALIAALVLLTAGAAEAAPLPPSASTGKPDMVTSSSARATGTVDPHGLPTNYFFRYGASKSYGFATLSTSAGTGSAPLPVSAQLTPLSAETTYHVQLVAENAAGTSFGSDRTFTTKPTPNTVILGTAPNPVLFGHTVAIDGQLKGAGAAGAKVTLQADPFPYPPGGFPQVGNPVVTNNFGFFSFTALPTFTTQYRVVATGKANPVTAVAVVGVVLRVHVDIHRSHNHRVVPLIHGLATPGHPGSLALLERLSRGNYRIVGVMTLHGGSATTPSGFAGRIRVHVTGRYRVEVRATDGSNFPGFSTTFGLRAS
ncbi:MAG: hypothetical protein ACR2HD_06775 [Solirubrobacteraceae bacterium]|nr:MAG: hypothetical protein DLM63_07615 [Solirubrobacterales bacterium]